VDGKPPKIKYVRWDGENPVLRIRVPEVLQAVYGKQEITKVPTATQLGPLKDEAAEWGAGWKNTFRDSKKDPMTAVLRLNPNLRRLEEIDDLAGEMGFPSMARSPLASATPKRQHSGIIFESVFEKWKRGVSDKEVTNTRSEMKHFSAFIGTDDMAAASRKDFIGYKDHLVDLFYDEEASSKTVSNRWKRLTALYAYALNNDKEEVLTDNFSRVKLDITIESESRDDFTPDEVKRSLLASLKTPDQAVKWFQWLGAFTGLRDSEIMRAHKDSIRLINGVWCFCVLKKYGLKTKNSERNYPLHSAIIAQGFLDYVESLPDGSRLFPDYNEDNVFKPLADFYSDLNIDKRFYSLRHTVTTHFRFRTDVDDDVKQYLMGHAPKSVHARYGAYPAEKLAPAIETIASPV
jgi:integrase